MNKNHPMNRGAGARARCAAVFFAATLLHAGQTRIWTQGDFSDYEKAILKNLSLRSDGRLSSARRYSAAASSIVPLRSRI